MTTNCVWLSVDPVRRKVDFYPKAIAARIQKSYNERDPWQPSTCVLGSDFFNATIHFHTSGSIYQTTPGVSMGRAGFKQPGYRSVKRFVLNENQDRVIVWSKQIYGEWRIAHSEGDSEIRFEESIPLDVKIEITDEDIQIQKIETWKPEDLNSGSWDTNVVVWQWCRGTVENQGNLLTLSEDWYVPYNFSITQQIELAFNNNNNDTIINLPLIGQRNIEFIYNSCYAKQISLDRRKTRFVRRIVTTIQQLKVMLDRISRPPIDITQILENLPNDTVPHHFNCPILQDIMKDPVKTVDGHIYDRSSIERWFTLNTTSPLTGLSLHSTILEPHTELKKQIDDFLNSLINKNEKKISVALEI